MAGGCPCGRANAFIMPPFPRSAGMHVKHQVHYISERFFIITTQMQTLLEFADTELITRLLIKERAKCRRRNYSHQYHGLNHDCSIDELAVRKQLSRMMPPRRNWVRPSNRLNLNNDAVDTSKNAQKSLCLTLNRDRKLQKEENRQFRYLDELDAYISKIQERLSTDNLTLSSPRLMPIFKKIKENGVVVCRPLSIYEKLDDKIILALTAKYLTRYFDYALHENILSYRPARSFHGNEHHTTDFNDGVRLINEFRDKHNNEEIYAADCDIQKFYDIIPHDTVRRCFADMLKASSLNNEGQQQVMRVVNAYLSSYNFYDNAWREAQEHPEVFYKVRRKFARMNEELSYRLEWVPDLERMSDQERKPVGVPQGGSLSLLIANIVLNDVDKVVVGAEDENRLFIRYCDDMILLHTNHTECERLMNAYAESLNKHGLYYHDFCTVSDVKERNADGEYGEKTSAKFWNQKSRHPFLWGYGPGDSNAYIGFLGYEIRRDGVMRLRKSNIKRFEEKCRRLYYALRRYRNKGGITEEEFQHHLTKVTKNLLSGVEWYDAFDMPRFMRSTQYRQIQRRVNWLKNARY